ncbi:hypothetical protein AOLI_G00253340 [Acnodon oligacanthus]
MSVRSGVVAARLTFCLSASVPPLRAYVTATGGASFCFAISGQKVGQRGEPERGGSDGLNHVTDSCFPELRCV